MARVLQRLVATARDFARGVDAGHAIRHGAPVTGGERVAAEPAASTVGGPYLHWVPDGAGGSRLAGELVPSHPAGGPDRAVRSGP